MSTLRAQEKTLDSKTSTLTVQDAEALLKQENQHHQVVSKWPGCSG